MNNIKAVIFDIDGTLTTENSWHFLCEQLGGEELAQAELKYFKQFLNGELAKKESDQKILDLWKSTGIANKSKFTEIFNRVSLRTDAKEIVDHLKSKNLIVCMITGSMDLYAQVIGQRLGLKDYYSNATLYWAEDGTISSFDYFADQAKKKLEQFKEFCAKNSLLPEECVVVGDSDNDYELFKITKKGIAVRTEFEDKELERLAWKVIDNLTELKEII